MVRKFNFDAYSKGQAVDIEKFITEYLKYQIIYDNIAEEDAGKTAFLGDGKASLCVWRDGNRVRIVPPANVIVIDKHFAQSKMTAPRNFKLAHEAGHIIMDMLSGNAVVAAFNNEFDSEQKYTIGVYKCRLDDIHGHAVIRVRIEDSSPLIDTILLLFVSKMSVATSLPIW